jgi:chaperonin GroES
MKGEKNMKFKPLGDRLLVKRVDEEEKTKGGIIIPDTAKEKPQEAEVVAVGEGKWLESGKRQPLPIQVGERVIFSKYSGTELKVEGIEHLIIKEEDVLGVLQQ